MQPVMKAICLITLFGAALLPGATQYSVVNLGSFGGSSSIAYHIDNAGLVVGWSQTSLNDYHAFSATGGSPQDMNPGAASNSFAYGANGAGQIVGTSYINGETYGTIWSGSGVSYLGPGTSATSINASGQIAGGNGHAVVYDNGKLTDLGTLPGGNWSAGYGINDNGMVAGYGSTASGFRAFTWTADSGFSMLGTLGGNSSYAMGINNQGQVAGNSIAADRYAHAFIATNGILTDLGTAGSNSYAYGINNAGAVVGYNAAGAFLYNGSVLNLNSLIGSNSGWQLEQAYSINDSGKIVGTGLFEGQSRAFELDPLTLGPAGPAVAAVPEPGSIALFGMGLTLIAVGRRLKLRVRRNP